MAFLNGVRMLVIVDGTAISGTKSFTLNVNQDLPDTTTKDDASWASNIYGAKSWEVTYDGLYDPSGVTNAEELIDIITNSTEITLELAVIDGTGGGLLLSGSANSTGMSMVAEVNQPITISGRFRGNGELTKGTVVAS